MTDESFRTPVITVKLRRRSTRRLLASQYLSGDPQLVYQCRVAFRQSLKNVPGANCDALPNEVDSRQP